MITYYPTLPANWITSGDRIKWAIMVRGLGDHLTDDTITQNYKSAGDIGGLKLEHGGRPKFRRSSISSLTKSVYKPKDLQKLKDLRAHLEKLADLCGKLSSLGRTISDAELPSTSRSTLLPATTPQLTPLPTPMRWQLRPTTVIRMAIKKDEQRRLHKKRAIAGRWLGKERWEGREGRERWRFQGQGQERKKGRANAAAVESPEDVLGRHH